METKRAEIRGLGLFGAVLALALMGAGCDGNGTDDTDGGLQTDGGVIDGDDGGTTDAGTDGGMIEPNNQIAVVRLNSDGTVDTDFGEEGVATLEFGEGAGGPQDLLWDLKLDSEGRAVLFGSGKAPGRTDQDRYVARLTTSGALDTTFGTAGMVTLDAQGLNDNARGGTVQQDGKILASGYTPVPTGVGTQTANAIILQRLNADGSPDMSFGTDGVVQSNPFSLDDMTPWGMAEAYSVVQQSTGAYVTTGYGRMASSGPVDLVSFRYGAEDGALDVTWGVDGNLVLDVSADHDRGRNLTVLPDDSTVHVGSAAVAPNTLDAMIFVADENGEPADGFNTDGYRLFDFGAADEAFFGVAAAADGSWIAAVGYSAQPGGMDATLALLSTLNEVSTFAEVTPISTTAMDRFWAVTFGPDNKVYAAGVIDEGGDHQMLVVRFNTDGSRDPTFGTEGVVRINVREAGTVEAARAIAVQADGKIIVGGAVESL